MTYDPDSNSQGPRPDAPRDSNASNGHASLVDERGRTIAWVIRDISRLYTAVGQKALAPWNITMAHWYYLRVLEEGPLNQLELSGRVGIAPTTAVPALDFLEKQELVVRTRDPQDRRKSNVSLTQQGRRLIAEVMEAFEPVVEDSMKGVSASDLEIVWRNLLRIESNLVAALGAAASASQVL